MRLNPIFRWLRITLVVAVLLAAVGALAMATRSETSVDTKSPATMGPLSQPLLAAQRSTVAEPAWGGLHLIANRRLDGDQPLGMIRVRGASMTAAWQVVDSRPRAEWETHLEASFRSASGEWSRPQIIAPRASGLYGPFDVALGPRRIVAVSWTQTVGNVASAVVRLSEGGTWTRPHVLGQGSDASVVIDPRGVVTVAWLGSDNNGTVLFTSRWVQGQWEPAEVVAHNGGIPVLAGNRRGDLAMASSTYAGVDVFTRRHGRCCWERTALRSAFEYPDEVRIAIDDHGQALVVWGRSAEEGWPRLKHLAWSQSLADGTWTQPLYLDDQIKDVVEYMRLSMNAQGETVVVWSGEVTRAARFDFSRGWTRPATLPGWVYGTHMTDSGTAVAVVYDGNGNDTWMLQQPSGKWRVGGPTANGEQMDVHGSGQRMASLYFNSPSLESDVLDIPVGRAP